MNLAAAFEHYPGQGDLYARARLALAAACSPLRGKYQPCMGRRLWCRLGVEHISVW